MDVHTGSSVTFKVKRADNMVLISGGGQTFHVYGPGNPPLNETKEIRVPFGAHYFNVVAVNTGQSHHILVEVIVGGKVVEEMSISGMEQNVVLNRTFLMVNSQKP